jgi:hypothetical protein
VLGSVSSESILTSWKDFVSEVDMVRYVHCSGQKDQKENIFPAVLPHLSPFNRPDLKLLSSFCQLNALHACIHRLLGMRMKGCSFLEHGIR